MKIPLNRVVAFAGPYLSIIAGAIAAWVIAKWNVLAIPGLGLNGDTLATEITAGLTLALTAGLSHLGQMKWLKGVHIEMVNEAGVQAAVLNNPSEPATLGAGIGSVVTKWTAAETGAEAEEMLPPDAEEFAAPPSGPPIQPSQDPAIEIPEPGAPDPGVVERR